jgi:hypothetical protein
MAHHPPDHSKGDANTVGGYAAVHGRPAAFEGSDGVPYSVEVVADETGDPSRPWGAYLLFLKWRPEGSQNVEGHLETDFLAWGASEAEVAAAAGRLLLSDALGHLERLLTARRAAASSDEPQRPWWEAMRDA